MLSGFAQWLRFFGADPVLPLFLHQGISVLFCIQFFQINRETQEDDFLVLALFICNVKIDMG